MHAEVTIGQYATIVGQSGVSTLRQRRQMYTSQAAVTPCEQSQTGSTLLAGTL